MVTATLGCHSKQNKSDTQQVPRFVLVGEEGIYQNPDRSSPKVATLSFGQEVSASEKKRTSNGQSWEEVHFGPDLSGYMRSSALGTPELIDKMRSLMKSVDGLVPQASGVTSASANFRLEPSSAAQAIESLPAGTHFEMFERQASFAPQVSKALEIKLIEPKPRKEVWYKVRVPDGRVGYIHSKNLQFEPPPELAQYTHSRRALAWQKFPSPKPENSDSTLDFVVAYATPGMDFGADYNRVEIYTSKDKVFQTAFVQSSLKGILPIQVIQEGNEVFFELRELDDKQPGQVFVHRYHFPRPIKEVSKSKLEGDVGLH